MNLDLYCNMQMVGSEFEFMYPNSFVSTVQATAGIVMAW